MGMFDTVTIDCPKCGEFMDGQSKSGDCMLRTYTFEEAPSQVMSGLWFDPCSNCGARLRVEPVIRPTFKIVVVGDEE